MRGVPEGRGESEYLLRKYSEMPTFLRKVGTPSDPAAPGFARIHRATSPMNGGGKRFFNTLRAHCKKQRALPHIKKKSRTKVRLWWRLQDSNL